MPPLRGLIGRRGRFYTDAAPTGLKSIYSRRILYTTRKVFPPETALLVVTNTSIFLKLTPMVRFATAPYMSI